MFNDFKGLSETDSSATKTLLVFKHFSDLDYIEKSNTFKTHR